MSLFSKFGKKLTKSEAAKPQEQSVSVNRELFAAKFVMADGSTYQIEPPAQDFDPVTKQAVPWELSGTGIVDKLYIANPYKTFNPADESKSPQSLYLGSLPCFHVMNDGRNPENMRGVFCTSQSPISKVFYSQPVHEPVQSANEQMYDTVQPDAQPRMDRPASSVSRPGMNVVTASGSGYSFEPTRNPDVWHMTDHNRGGTYDIAPVRDTYAKINADRAARSQQPVIAGEGSQMYFEVLNTQRNLSQGNFKPGINHTSTVSSMHAYEPKWMERDRTCGVDVDFSDSSMQADTGYDFE